VKWKILNLSLLYKTLHHLLSNIFAADESWLQKQVCKSGSHEKQKGQFLKINGNCATAVRIMKLTKTNLKMYNFLN
jgi:hypothetical protein